MPNFPGNPETVVQAMKSSLQSAYQVPRGDWGLLVEKPNYGIELPEQDLVYADAKTPAHAVGNPITTERLRRSS